MATTIEAARSRRWVAIPSWGRDSWDLGLLAIRGIYHRATSEGFDLAENVEGDITYYRYPSRELRDAATDQIAFWHWKHEGEGMGRGRRVSRRRAPPLRAVLPGALRSMSSGGGAETSPA